MFNTLTAVIILALIQGLCEFLPISSSGHLVLAQAFFGFKEPEIIFDLVLHLGTLLAVVYFYRVSLLKLLRALKLIPSALLSLNRLAFLYSTNPDFRLGSLIVIGSVPTALTGLIFQDFLRSLFSSLQAVAVALLITALVLASSALKKLNPQESVFDLTIIKALLIGLAQGAAIAPGLSRSGLTIVCALWLGLGRELAAKYSFLLSIPAIIGGLLLSLNFGQSNSFSFNFLLIGLVVAALTGYLSLRLLTALVARNRLPLFSLWCAAMGLAALYFN
ncbi:MAG: undecaprenyl-diphosphate phosphatase [Deltaproteobacteria bacterium]|nr:undecaprenyl-diphosphate phosphatase [Deltaproteobacteria bacterium]